MRPMWWRLFLLVALVRAEAGGQRSKTVSFNLSYKNTFNILVMQVNNERDDIDSKTTPTATPRTTSTSSETTTPAETSTSSFSGH